MSHEARINDALRALGEEFRLGMVAAGEYRARRRKILETWGERDATTSPGSLRSATQPGPGAARSSAPAPKSAPTAVRRAGNPMGLVIGIVVTLLLAGVGAYFVVDSNRKPPPPPGEAAAPASPEVQAIGQAADEFLARNDWEAEAIGTFLARWRALDPALRAEAADQPSLRTLRYRLGENITAESQLLGQDATPAERARLDMLQAFADELDQ